MFDWIQQLADWLVFDMLHLKEGDHLTEALNFFIYDSIKILLLVFVIIFFMGIVNSYFPVEKVKNYLSRKKLYGFEYLMASLFGVVTPFCSCSSVPLFIGFVKGGIPLGVTFAFLVTSPLVNEVAIGLFIGLFGIKTTVIYVISGVLLGTVSGIILQKLKLEKYLTPWVQQVLENSQKETEKFEIESTSFKDKLPFIWIESKTILKGILPYVIVGIAIGALMHGYIPEGFFEQYLSKDNLFAVPVATILAVVTFGFYNYYLNYVANVNYIEDRSLKPRTELGEWISSIAFAIIAATLVHTYVMQPYTIPTSSLEKSLLIGDFLFVNARCSSVYAPLCRQIILAKR